MKVITKEVLGFEVLINVAESVSELVQLAGNEDRAVGLANNYILFHSHFSKLRTQIVKKLEELTGVSREKDAEGKITENDAVYIGRLEDEGVKLTEFAPQIAELVAGLTVDYTQSERTPGDGSTKIAKKWLSFYDALVEGGKLETFINKYEIDVADLSEEDKKLVIVQKIKQIVTKAQEAAIAGVV